MYKYCLIIASLAMSPLTYALELHDAVLLEHRSWVSGGNALGSILEGHLEDNQNLYSSSTARASTSSVSGAIHSNVSLSGSHSYSITNTSGNYQTYTVNIKLCANSTYCFNDQARFGVKNGGSFSSNGGSHLTCMFSYAGNFSIEAVTSVSGDTSAYDSSRATLYIKA